MSFKKFRGVMANGAGSLIFAQIEKNEAEKHRCVVLRCSTVLVLQLRGQP